MADIGNLFQGLFGLSQISAGAEIAAAGAQLQAQTIIQGGEVAAIGAQLTASGFRESAKAVQAATGFNLDILQQNSLRQLAAVSRQFQRTLGSQIVTQARSGLSLTSKSFLLVQSESIDVFNDTLNKIKIDAENQRRSQVFQSQIRQVNLENQARAADFRASAERVLASNRAAEAAFQGEISQFQAQQKVARGIPTILSQAFQGDFS